MSGLSGSTGRNDIHKLVLTVSVAGREALTVSVAGREALTVSVAGPDAPDDESQGVRVLTAFSASAFESRFPLRPSGT